MVGVWSQTLLSAAEISNFFSAIGVLLCFICMVIFILRVQGIHFTSSVVHIGQPSPVQVNYQKVEIPFICFLSKDSSSTNELEFRISYDVACYFQVFWSVPSNKLKDLIYAPWRSFAEKLELFEPEKTNETKIIRLVKESSSVLLGKAPRTHFPLVLVLSRQSTPFDVNSSVGSLISVVHISDEDCPMPSAIIYQYLKLYSGQLTQLQTLYTQRKELDLDKKHEEGDETMASFVDSVEDKLNEEGACVICRVMQPTRALLPCRHVCICSYCFTRLEFCPLCRSRISAYFLTDTKEEKRQLSVAHNNLEEDANLGRHRSFLNNMNGVLNSFLGIRDD
ncbi:Cell growth regulator with RING finger domain protein 1 [Armadillidium vulgare]|nr:Cell growth regulator with RING finger domain protein 1 [Armadillidium vulgare]